VHLKHSGDGSEKEMFPGEGVDKGQNAVSWEELARDGYKLS
jgi:hypothetical protein